MSKVVKIPLIIAAILVVLGIIVLVAGIALNGTSWMFGSSKYEEKVIELTEPFDSIRVDCDSCDVSFAVAEDGNARIEARIQETKKLTANVEDSTLVISCKDERKLFQLFTFRSFSDKMTVYLPQKTYDSLVMTTASGDILVPVNFEFKTAKITTASGDINFQANVRSSLDFTLASGDLYIGNLDGSAATVCKGASSDITLKDIRCGELKIELASGDLKMEEVRPEKLTIKTASGEINMNAVVCSGVMSIKTASGDVNFRGCDAGTIQIETSSGDVEGTFLTNKVFHTHTAAGDVRLPDERSGGDCTINTASGDIIIKIAN